MPSDMVVRVGINGFGRIGRVIFRTCLQNTDIELSAINDPAITAEYICYLIKFDSTHGKFNKNVNYDNNEITVEDRVIKIFHEKMPSTIPWHTAGVQYVVEASGMFTTLEKASGHLQSEGVKRVIVTAPSSDVPMIILGVNDFRLRPEHKVISCASSTLYCLAPIIKVLEDQFGITEGFVTSIHAMTPSLKPLDGLCLRGRHWRDHRSIHQNIIPASTGACKALGKIIPQVKDKMSGLAFRVPIVNVSVLDITIRLKSNTTLQDIVTNIEKASATHMKNILKISRDETVSSDYFGESYSCIFDSESSLQLKTNFFKLICWYENEYSYACRVIDSIFYFERQFSLGRISSKMTHLRTKLTNKCDEVQQEECFNKEILEHKNNADLYSTSQDTGFKAKESNRNAVLKKPVSAHISGRMSPVMGKETKRRNEIFKIWNDCNDISKSCVRQNRGSFFHSCISFAPQNIKTNNVKANTYIENEKQDGNEMTNITDDLFKKNDKAVAEAKLTNSIYNDKKLSSLINDSQEQRAKESSQKCNRKVNTMRTFDICGDYENKTKMTDSKLLHGCSKEELIRTYDSYNKAISELNMIARKDSSKQKTEKLFPNTKSQKSFPLEVLKKNKSGSQRCQGAENESKIFKDDNVFKDQVAKAINTLIDGLEQSFRVPCPSDHRNLRKGSIFRVKEDSKADVRNGTVRMETSRSRTTEPDNKDECKENAKTENKVDKINISDMANKTKKGNNINTTSARKYKIIHLNKLCTNRSFREVSLNRTPKRENTEQDKYFSKQILDGLNKVRPDPVVMIRGDKTPSSPDSSSGTKNIINNGSKQDIFDKLESVSETDSDNSFEIHGRKSQVIHITDLTKSLQDLANLDKICRIMEISDELSDKLFSSLNTADGQDCKQKKWSFKDLCERIKLDEFCNKVFGKTAL